MFQGALAKWFFILNEVRSGQQAGADHEPPAAEEFIVQLDEMAFAIAFIAAGLGGKMPDVAPALRAGRDRPAQ